MKLLYYLPAIGDPDIETKHKILMHNIHYIYNTIREPFSICINFYTISDHIKICLYLLPFIQHLYIYEKHGVLTELFLTNPHNTHVSNFDYILFVLDDVKITDMDLNYMISVKEKYNIEILSPQILKSTHKFMNTYNELTINNFLEVYLLLLTPTDFHKFCSIHTLENKWMWGVDFLFGFYNIKTGVLPKCIAEHILPSSANQKEAERLMTEYIIKHTKYETFSNILNNFTPIICTICI